MAVLSKPFRDGNLGNYVCPVYTVGTPTYAEWSRDFRQPPESGVMCIYNGSLYTGSRSGVTMTWTAVGTVTGNKAPTFASDTAATVTAFLTATGLTLSAGDVYYNSTNKEWRVAIDATGGSGHWGSLVLPASIIPSLTTANLTAAAYLAAVGHALAVGSVAFDSTVNSLKVCASLTGPVWGSVCLVTDIVPQLTTANLTAAAYLAATGRTLFVGALAIDTDVGALKMCTDASAPTWVTLLTSAALSFTGRATTTDGVAGGTARVIGGRAYTNVADGTSLTNTTNETVLGSYDIPASTLKAGSVLRCRYAVVQDSVHSSDTLLVRLRLGPTTLIGTALNTGIAYNGTTNDVQMGEFNFLCKEAPGATAACVGNGSIVAGGALTNGTSAGAGAGTHLVSTTFATNGILHLEVTGKYSAASSSNACHLDMLEVTIV